MANVYLLPRHHAEVMVLPYSSLLQAAVFLMCELHVYILNNDWLYFVF
jgi:hypothetical protein